MGVHTKKKSEHGDQAGAPEEDGKLSWDTQEADGTKEALPSLIHLHHLLLGH